jgi:hypothetical protein
MINAFIHLGVSPHYFSNWKLAGQFYQVFSHFAEAGEFARLYLLRTHTVGRFLDIFLHAYAGDKSNPQITECYRGTSLSYIPLFVLDRELYLSSTGAGKSEFKMSLLEKKGILADATAPLMFLLYTVSVLARSCEFTKDTVSKLANDNLRYKLDPDEIGMIVQHQVKQLWQECERSKVVRNSMALMFAHISHDNKEFSLQFLQLSLLNNLNVATFDQMKTYERPLIQMLLIEDQYALERAKKVMTGLLEIMKQNAIYYKEVDQVIEIFYKVLQRSTHAVEYLSKAPTLMK